MPIWARPFQRQAAPLCLPQPGSRSPLGISLRVDELAAGTPSGYGYLGDRVRVIFGICSPCRPRLCSQVTLGEFTLTTAQPLAALLVRVVTALNYFSVGRTGEIQVALTGLKMGRIFLIVVGGGLFGKQNGSRAAARRPAWFRNHRRFTHRLWLLPCGPTTASMISATLTAAMAISALGALHDSSYGHLRTRSSPRRGTNRCPHYLTPWRVTASSSTLPSFFGRPAAH